MDLVEVVGWRRIEAVPLLLPAVATLAGTLVAEGFRSATSNGLLLVLTLLFAAAAWAYFRQLPRACFALMLAGFFMCGWLGNQATFLQRKAQLQVLSPLLEPGISPEWNGFLYKDPQVESGKTILYLQLESAQHNGAVIPINTKARLGVFPAEGQEVRFAFGEPLYGDRIQIRAPLNRPRNFQNPGMFDYVAKLERDGILLTGSIKSPLQVMRVASGSGSPLLAAVYDMRRSFQKYLHNQFVGINNGEIFSSILAALLFGDQSRLNPHIERLFQETGTYHIFVVSGFNTTIIALTLVWVLRKLRFPTILVVLLSGFVLAAYALMTELGSSVVRASILSFIVLLADALYRQGNILNSLAIAVVSSLLVWPDLARDAGFQMTYLACLAIVLIGVPVLQCAVNPFRNALNSLYAENSFLIQRDAFSQMARRFRFELEMLTELLMRDIPMKKEHKKRLVAFLGRRLAMVVFYFGSLLVVSVAVQMVMTPLMAYLFNRANVGGFLANLIVVPLMTVLLLCTLSLGGFLWALGWTYKPWILASGWILEHLLVWLESLSQSGFWHWRVAMPPWEWIILYLALLLLATQPFRVALRRPAAIAALLILPTFWWSPFPMHRQSPGKMEAYFLDVGQGDSIFIISPEGRTLLMDAGGLLRSGYAEEPAPDQGLQEARFDIGEDVVSRFLWALRVPKIDAVVLSHPDLDHVGGLGAVIGNFRIGALKAPWPIAKVQALLPHLTQLTAQRGVEWSSLRRGESWGLDRMLVEVLSPPESLLAPYAQINNRSAVLQVSVGGPRVLLTGDIDRLVESDLARGCSRLKSAILKVPHHGSASSSTELFLDCVQPRWAIISSGWNRRYSHPSPAVLQRLHSRAIEVLQTSIQGAIYAAVSPDSIVVKPALSHKKSGG